ncbi:hypothetical protein OSB04_011088 [Centaurea solstitialis]|uniref:Uncharacterized protein n=1 Tax=Centaurea solstitialis TaxID=347529 RepID=A0AA38WNS2_9ASTR|nr:hypothetical protein OSB04_011088 [Centaurea solstitialis]
METTCVSLINELQKIWNEVGETEDDRDKMLLELEQECLEAYRRKVEQASRFRAQLIQAVADSEAELAHVCASLGEQPLSVKQFERSSLKKKLAAIFPQLEMMQNKKSERMLQFTEILDQIHNISRNYPQRTNHTYSVIDESDLSLRRLEEFKTMLHAWKRRRMDFGSIVVGFILLWRILLQDLTTTMVELWTLMDISNEEQQPFQNYTCYIAASEDEIIEPNALSLESIKFIETEISRLQQLKASKIKEVLLKKRVDLEQLCRQAHMPVVMHGAIDFSAETLESGKSLIIKGDIDPLYLLEQVDFQISKVKEEASSRKDILEKIDKWLAACEEETWLEEYNRDHNRYNCGRGTHLLLKRAERARALVDKVPAMVETLREKARAWEQESGVAFSYDGDQRKLQGQLIAEQEVRFGSKPSPFKSGKKVVKPPNGGSNDKRNSVAGVMLKTPKHNQTGLSSNLGNLQNRYQNSGQAKTHAAPKTASDHKSSVAATTPSKTLVSSVDHEDNMKTPKTTIPSMPSTPATTSMKMAMTPSTPFVPPGADGVEYSFEEIRAGRFSAKRGCSVRIMELESIEEIGIEFDGI